MSTEFGNAQPVRFVTGIMRDGEGNEVLCKCGKPAGCAIMGKEAHVVYCSDCSPVSEYSADLVYRPPNESTRIEL